MLHVRMTCREDREDPAYWFLVVKASIQQVRISNEITKAHSPSLHLDVNLIPYIKDLVTENPSPAKLYTFIQERLLSKFAASSVTHLRQLLQGEVSADGKPSLILNCH